MEIRTILVPTDYSDSATAALGTAVEMARSFGARLVLLHASRIEIPIVFALEGSFAFPDGFQEKVLAESEARIENTARDLADDEGVDATGLFVFDRAETAILERARELPADLIVMGTRGLTGLHHTMLGSVAERVVRLASCPVMTVHASNES